MIWHAKIKWQEESEKAKEREKEMTKRAANINATEAIRQNITSLK